MAEGGEAGLDEALRGMVRDEPVRFGMSPERWAAEAERKAKETKARAAVAETRARIMQQRIARQAAAKKKADGAGE